MLIVDTPHTLSLFLLHMHITLSDTNVSYLSIRDVVNSRVDYLTVVSGCGGRGLRSVFLGMVVETLSSMVVLLGRVAQMVSDTTRDRSP